MAEQAIVDLPYPFEVRYKPFKHRNVSKRMAWSTIPVHIASVSSQEAPVVLEWLQQDSYVETSDENKLRFYPDGPSKYVLRSFDGRLYAPLGSREGMPLDEFVQEAVRERNRFMGPANKFSASEYPSFPAVPLHDQGRDMPTNYLHWNETLERFAYEKSRHISDDKDAGAFEAAAVLKDAFVVVDGRVWTTTGAREPKLRVANGAFPDIGFTCAPESIHYCSDFPAWEVEKALAFAQSQGIEAPMTKDVVSVYDVSSLQSDGIVMTARQAMECLCSAITNRDSFERWPEEATRLVDEIRAIRNSRQIDLSRAVQVLESFERLEDLFSGMERRTDAGEMMAKVAPAIWRWTSLERPTRPDAVEASRDNQEDYAALMGL